MVDSIKDVLQKKADKFDEEHSTIEQIQAILDEHFNSDVRAFKITDDNTLIITTANASLASEARLSSTEIKRKINTKLKLRVRIKIRIS